MPSPDLLEKIAALTQANPERYQRLAKPFDSQESMDEAMAGFFRELGELREKYKIPDVLCVASANYMTGSVVNKGVSNMQYGNMQLRPTLVLYLYRQEGPMIQALIEGLST